MKKRALMSMVSVVIVSTFMITVLGWGVAAGQDKSKYPTSPIEYVVQSGAGGSSDIFVRTLADILGTAKIVQVPIVVTNKPGGSGATAFKYVAHQKGNPYFLLNAASNFTTTPLTSPGTPGYGDFTPIALLAIEPLAVAVNAQSPYKTLADLIEAAKKSNQGLTWAASSVGNFDHMLCLLTKNITGAKFNYMPFTTGAEVVTSILGGHAQVGGGGLASFWEQAEAGKIRILGVDLETRLANRPNIPTLKEQGVNVVMKFPRGVVAPKGIPDNAKAFLISAFQQLTQTARWKTYLNENDLSGSYLYGADYEKYLRETTDQSRRLLTEVGLIK